MHRSIPLLFTAALLSLVVACRSQESPGDPAANALSNLNQNGADPMMTVTLKIDGFMKSKSGAT